MYVLLLRLVQQPYVHSEDDFGITGNIVGAAMSEA